MDIFCVCFFRATSVLDEKGKVVEKGEAIKGKGDWWEYVPGAEGKVVVETRDLAGNVVREEMNI